MYIIVFLINIIVAKCMPRIRSIKGLNKNKGYDKLFTE